MIKRIINLSIALLISTVSIFGNTTTPSISTDGTKSFTLLTKTWKSEFVNIKIKDATGLTIFSDKYATKKDKKFSLASLPSGTYSIIVSNSQKSTIQAIDIAGDKLVLDPNIATQYKPQFKVSGNTVDLNYFANGSKTKIVIYDENEEVYTASYSDLQTVNKRFELKDLNKGHYTISVITNGDIYSKVITK